MSGTPANVLRYAAFTDPREVTQLGRPRRNNAERRTATGTRQGRRVPGDAVTGAARRRRRGVRRPVLDPRGRGAVLRARMGTSGAGRTTGRHPPELVHVRRSAVRVIGS